MKKKKSTKAKVRNLVRCLVILFLSMIVTFICCKKESAANDKILEKTVTDAFVFQSMMLVHNLEPNKPNSFTDIEALENDSDSFVSDAAIKTGKSQYYIRVNYSANCVTIYSKDDEGNYTKPYKAMICSTGKATPKSGTYKITYKYRWLRLYGDVYGQYSTRIVNSILFHSVPYFEQSANTLEYEEYDKLGTTASAGCIRLTVQDAKWIYDNITSGTYVEFYSDKSNPGPLGKPTAQKISDNKECRDWDPTDPDKNNPWNGGSGIPSVTYKNTKPTNTTTDKNETLNNNTNTDKEQNTNTTSNNHTNTIIDEKENTNTDIDKKEDNNTSIDKNETINNDKDKETTNSTTNSTSPDSNTNTNTNTSSSNTTSDNNKNITDTNSNTNTQTNTSKPTENTLTNTTSNNV